MKEVFLNTLSVGVVVIGRNEGDRLKACLQSILKHKLPIVYVDSGSNDGSREYALSFGVDVLDLDMSKPFTAARARNEGFARLLDAYSDLSYVQFVDGDCEVVDTWFSESISAIQSAATLAVVCGRRKERYPEHTIFNFMCDLEWNTPVGDAKACGGDALMRVSAFKAMGGFSPALIAGEEPELCLRMRRQGWKIKRIDALMTIHDAAITKFSQWWRRTVRAGHAFAEGAYLHGNSPEKHWVKETIRPWFWAFLVPIIAALVACFNWVLALLILMLYPAQIIKIAFQSDNASDIKLALKLASFSVLGKFAEMKGQIDFLFGLLSNQKSKIIEYK